MEESAGYFSGDLREMKSGLSGGHILQPEKEKTEQENSEFTSQ